jgi:hypothetical protein
MTPDRARSGALHKLPVGVLPGDLAVTELEKVAAAYLDPLALGGRPGQLPLRQPRSPLTQ